MAFPFPKGSTVRQKVPVIEGKISMTRFDESSQELSYHVDYKLGSENHSRWFKESELDLIKAPDPAPEKKAEAPAPVKK